ncbi:lysophospholipid acyltransferase family protein [Amphiplicatus metriothermophilus]|uniref:KDO2-lipid IV(A) lauroyltransferase n=1 Tax=Amphiplicatus metriothermophilus TaxID=1519374 RepID=A0A239PS98_9PROT|nr:lysophospholipid acyltransferase family protein [Amphiplicatus metriothermophilus]MBB5519104.1 KDO2-lipid IV(A) lauroyltransferase [Amphiplicatus metriothermophilus]SNT73174.1 KDO2-lipid IV(A) lauroyltransferase [Amphiplicatus metriothermophilus]
MTRSSLDVAEETPLPAPRSNRPATIGHRIEYAATRFLFFLFGLIGVDRASALAGGFTRFVGPKLRRISARGEENLRRAFPDWSENAVRRAVAGVWENLGRTAAEFAHLDRFDPFAPDSRVEIVGAERLRAVAAGAGPAIFVSGHFANWEVMSVALKAAGVDYAVVYRAANNPLVDALIIETRARVMSRHQIPKGKRGARALVEALRAGRSLAMLVDQKLNDGIAVPFMGRPAMTTPAPARLALKFGAPVIPMGIERLAGARFRLTVYDPIAHAPTGDLAEDVRSLTILINEALEARIRARPEQWLWLHRRWPKDDGAPA